MFENYEWEALLRSLEGGLEYREARFLENPSYPITVAGHAAPELLVKVNYDRGRFDEPTVARMMGHLRTLLEGIASDPHRPVADLPMLTKDERHQLLVTWNRTEADYPRERRVHELFESWAGRTPDALAVAGGGRRLTYGELNARANGLAHRLRALGVGPEVPVGLCLEPSPEAVVGMLGALKAGGAYVPLDPEDSRERLGFMLRDTRVPALLTRRGLLQRIDNPLPRLPEGEVPVICLDEGPGASRAENPDAPSGELAYIIYTSGSTGAPKGVEVLHAGLANLVAWHRRAYGVTPADRMSQVARLAFDASVWEIWPYLTAGASVHIPDRETRMSPGRVVAWLAAERITLCFLPTPLMEAALEEAWPEGLALRALFTGGDRLHRIPGRDYPFRIVNHYGPTEYTVVTTCAPVSPEDREPPIGRPIANTRVYVLDARMRPVPVGVPGELYIGGEGLARGYLNRPELTAERFVPDPFGASPEARLYRTGDRVRYRPDGNLEFLGRMDQQVKIRGFRVEPGEIEAALVRHAGVREAAVVAREGASGQRLVAYVVPEGAPPGPDELRAFLQERLPAYMVPQAFVRLDSLPLTANGKVDRRGLPAPDDSGSPASEPRSPVEGALAAIWAEALGVERVGIHDNFFELGGHSLLAARLISRVGAELGVELPLQALFDAPTVAELALALTRRQAGETDREDLERLLSELEGLSDEEAERHVARATSALSK
jgi:amino acid adenylation domain-containing protein